MQNVIIIRAELSGLSEKENLMRTAELESILEYKPYKTANGCYKGTKEASFVVQLCPNFTLDEATDIASQFGQESILMVDSGGCASLIYTDGSARYDILGYIVQVSREKARSLDAYTECQGRYYVVK